MMLWPIVRRLYSSTNTSYLCCSLSQSVARAANHVSYHPRGRGVATSLTHEELLDGIERELLLLQTDLVCVRGEANGKVSNDVGERGREENDLRVFGHLGDEAEGDEKTVSSRGLNRRRRTETNFLSVILWSPIEPDSSMLSASSSTKTLTSRKSRIRPLVTI